MELSLSDVVRGCGSGSEVLYGGEGLVGSSSGLDPLEGLSSERRFVKVHGSSLPHRQEDLQRRIVQHLAVWKRNLHQRI